MAKVVLLNKPFDVLCQFTDDQGRVTLADYITSPELRNVYPAGRLDRDSEGLVVLTNNGKLQHEISHPDKEHAKTYWVQVDGDIDDDAIASLRKGVVLNDGLTKPAQIERMQEPNIWPRSKPIRVRKKQPTSWIMIGLTEGRNRQVRRMTAAVGYPTLRLIRFAVGRWNLLNTQKNSQHMGKMLEPGEYLVEKVQAPKETRGMRETHIPSKLPNIKKKKNNKKILKRNIE